MHFAECILSGCIYFFKDILNLCRKLNGVFYMKKIFLFSIILSLFVVGCSFDSVKIANKNNPYNLKRPDVAETTAGVGISTKVLAVPTEYISIYRKKVNAIPEEDFKIIGIDYLYNHSEKDTVYFFEDPYVEKGAIYEYKVRYTNKENTDVITEVSEQIEIKNEGVPVTSSIANVCFDESVPAFVFEDAYYKNDDSNVCWSIIISTTVPEKISEAFDIISSTMSLNTVLPKRFLESKAGLTVEGFVKTVKTITKNDAEEDILTKINWDWLSSPTVKLYKENAEGEKEDVFCPLLKKEDYKDNNSGYDFTIPE